MWNTLWTRDILRQGYYEHVVVDMGPFMTKTLFWQEYHEHIVDMWPFWQGLNVYFVNTESRVPRTLYGNRIIFARVTWPFCEHKALYATGPMNILWTKRPLWYGYHGHVVKSFWEWYHRYLWTHDHILGIMSYPNDHNICFVSDSCVRVVYVILIHTILIKDILITQLHIKV